MGLYPWFPQSSLFFFLVFLLLQDNKVHFPDFRLRLGFRAHH